MTRRAGLELNVREFDNGFWGAVGPHWNELVQRTGDKSPFLSPQWMEAWIETFGATYRPSALTWMHAGETVGCALLCNARTRAGPLSVAQTYVNAAIDRVGCEHNEILALPEFRLAVLDDLVRTVVEMRTDELVLVGMRDVTAEAIRYRWPRRLGNGYLSRSPYVALRRLRREGSRDFQWVSTNTRSQIRRSLKAHEQRDGPRFIDVPASADAAVEPFDEMVAFHQQRWEREGEPGAFADEAALRFHRGLIRRWAGADRSAAILVPELMRIRFGDHTAGILYCLRYRGTVTFYQSGFAYSDDNRFKPGLAAHALAIERALDQGMEEYDFLGGEPVAARYKVSLSTDSRWLAWIRLPRSNAKMRIIDLARRGRGLLRGDQLSGTTRY